MDGEDPPPRRLAADVWEAIEAREAHEAHPICAAPTYWRQVVEARGGVPPTITSLYQDARSMLLPGIQASATLVRAGTVRLWEDVTRNVFRGETTSHDVPPEWAGGASGPSLRGTALRIWQSPPSMLGGAPPPPELLHSPTPNWLTTNSTMHLRLLYETLAPTAHRLRTGPCPFCGAEEASTWEHVLLECDSFWETVPVELQPWRFLCRDRGVGYAITGASTQMLIVLRHVTARLYEPCAPVRAGVG